MGTLSDIVNRVQALRKVGPEDSRRIILESLDGKTKIVHVLKDSNLGIHFHLEETERMTFVKVPGSGSVIRWVRVNIDGERVGEPAHEELIFENSQVILEPLMAHILEVTAGTVILVESDQAYDREKTIAVDPF